MKYFFIKKWLFYKILFCKGIKKNGSYKIYSNKLELNILFIIFVDYSKSILQEWLLFFKLLLLS